MLREERAGWRAIGCVCVGRARLVLLLAAIHIVASLCADARFFGSALRMFLLGADWSGGLVRPVFAAPWRLVLSHTTTFYVGVVGGALASWGPMAGPAINPVQVFRT
jgi:hypothetical protein